MTSNNDGSAPLAAEYELLGRYLADFSMLQTSLAALTGALIVPREAGDDAFDRASAVAAEVDASRLAGLLIEKLIDASAYDDVRDLKPRWLVLKKKILSEVEWRNEVAHSRLALTLTDEARFELWKSRRGTSTNVSSALIERHRRSIQALFLEILAWMSTARPSTRVPVSVEPTP